MSGDDRELEQSRRALEELDGLLKESGCRPWPEDVDEPEWERFPSSVAFADGVYLSRWPNGALRMLARVSNGVLTRWLRLDADNRSGCTREGSFGEKFYENGFLEDFSPYDDTSEPYRSVRTLGEWASKTCRLRILTASPAPLPAPVKAPPAPAKVEPTPVKYEQPDNPHQPVSRQTTPPNLHQLLEVFAESTLTSRAQIYSCLVDQIKLHPSWARDIANFAPEACSWALRFHGQKRRSTYLYPAWDQPGGFATGQLTEVAMFREVLKLAEPEGRRARRNPEHWVRGVAGALPSISELDEARPFPIIWTLPRRDLDPYWQVWVACQLLLRQQASTEGLLGEYLAEVEPQQFYRLASLAGTWLLGPCSTRANGFHPPSAPDTSAPLRKQLQQELMQLNAQLDEEPLWQRYPHFRDHHRAPAGGVHFFEPSWRKAPPLAALGQWVHQRCLPEPAPVSSRLEQHLGKNRGAELAPTVYSLGRFLSEQAPKVRKHIEAFSQGRFYWEHESEMREWPNPRFNELHDWTTHFKRQRLRARELATRLMDQQGPTALDRLDVNAFLYRVEVAVSTLVRGEGESDAHWRQLSDELNDYLKEPLTPAQLQALRQHIWETEIQPGPTLARCLGAILWSLDPWARPHQEQELVGLAVQLLGQLLPAL